MESLCDALKAKAAEVARMNPVRAEGVVTDIVGLLIESEGPAVSLGDLCSAATRPRETCSDSVVRLCLAESQPKPGITANEVEYFPQRR